MKNDGFSHTSCSIDRNAQFISNNIFDWHKTKSNSQQWFDWYYLYQRIRLTNSISVINVLHTCGFYNYIRSIQMMLMINFSTIYNVIWRMSVNIEINRLFRHLWKPSLVQVSEAVKSDPARRQQCQVDHTLYHRFKWSVLRTSTDAYELLYTNRNRKKNKKFPIEF